MHDNEYEQHREVRNRLTETLSMQQILSAIDLSSYDNSTSRAVKVPVEIERILDDKVAVKSGLENIGEVVSTGASDLRDGTLVRVEGVGGLSPEKTGTRAREE